MREKERELVCRVDSLVGEAVKREKSGERVLSHVAELKRLAKSVECQKRQVLGLKSKHDADHVDETGIEREISEVSKNMERPRIELDDFDDKTALS